MKALYWKYSQWLSNREIYYTQAQQNIELVKKYFNIERCSNYYKGIYNK